MYCSKHWGLGHTILAICLKSLKKQADTIEKPAILRISGLCIRLKTDKITFETASFLLNKIYYSIINFFTDTLLPKVIFTKYMPDAKLEI